MAEWIKEFMHVGRAANYLQCTKKHVYELIKSGDIEAIRLGERAIRISKESLGELIERQRIAPETYLSE
jgi:excisionase family DNA binding protein